MSGTSDACTVWIVGRVTKKWFFTEDGEPDERVNISILPWTKGTAHNVRRRLTALSQPQEGPCYFLCLHDRI